MNVFGDFFRNKKVLITGTTGFKGSWLSVWLNELGAAVYGYALPPKSKIDNFVITGLEDRITQKYGDVRDLDQLINYFTEVRPDIAFHLSAQPLVLESYRNPQETFATNMMGTVNFLEAVRLTGTVKATVIVTSDKCYQNNEWVWGYKETDRLGGNDPYSASKGCAELIVNSYVKSFFSGVESCQTATVRAGNVIGGGDWADNRIVPDFFRSMMRKEKLVLRYPFASRPWQYVLEPLSGYLYLCAKLYRDKKQFQGAWNFGPLDSNHYTVADLINKIIDFYGEGELEMIHKESQYHETTMLKLDISKAMKYLKWKPVLNFAETVQFTVSGYKDDLVGEELYSKRLEQINEFVLKAKNQSIEWTL